MTVEIKGYSRALDMSESIVCDYADVTVKETKMRNGGTKRQIRIQPEGVKRAKVFADGVFSTIIMCEATTGRRMLTWET